MKLLLCSATGRELAALAPGALAQAASLPETTTAPAPAGLFRGRIDATLCVTGVGPVNAALSLGMALASAQAAGAAYDAVLCTGLAGAYSLEELPLRSLCLVTEEIWPEYGLNDGTSVTARAFSFPLWQRGVEAVYDSLRLAAALPGSQGAPQEFVACRALTVAGVSASTARVQDLWNRYHAPLENMEGFAVAYAAARAGLPCVEVRCVSNKAGPRRRDEKDFDGALLAMADILPALKLC